MVRTSVGRAFALGLVGFVIFAPCAQAQEDFPFEHELLLDARPMKGSKRIPNLSVEPDGTATIDLWCNSMQAQINVNGEAISISAGEKSNQSCAPERQQADDDLAAALVAVTSWRWDGESLLLIGPKTLRFRQQTN
jgi:heat shock protein HslJ